MGKFTKNHQNLASATSSDQNKSIANGLDSSWNYSTMLLSTAGDGSERRDANMIGGIMRC